MMLHVVAGTVNSVVYETRLCNISPDRILSAIWQIGMMR